MFMMKQKDMQRKELLQELHLMKLKSSDVLNGTYIDSK